MILMEAEEKMEKSVQNNDITIYLYLLNRYLKSYSLFFYYFALVIGRDADANVWAQAR